MKRVCEVQLCTFSETGQQSGAAGLRAGNLRHCLVECSSLVLLHQHPPVGRSYHTGKERRGVVLLTFAIYLYERVCVIFVLI